MTTFKTYIRACVPDDGECRGYSHHMKHGGDRAAAEARMKELLAGSYGSLGLDPRYEHDVEMLELDEDELPVCLVTAGRIEEGMEYVEDGEVVIEVPHQKPARAYVQRGRKELPGFTRRWEDMHIVWRFRSVEEAKAWEVPKEAHQRRRICELIDLL